MAAAKITLMGMYHYDDTLFQNMVLPDGIDKDLIVQTLLLKGAEFEVLYADPDFMKQAIGIWSSKWFRTFSEWLRGTQATWNPIHNYDRFEEIKDDSHKKFDSKTSADYSDTRTPNLSDATTLNNTDTTTQTIDSTTQHDVSPYDAASFVPSSKDTINNGSSNVAHTGTVTVATTGTDSNRRAGTMDDTAGNEYNTFIHGAHVFGNIGITQASDMLASFYSISKWNLADHISDVFIGELLIPVY